MLHLTTLFNTRQISWRLTRVLLTVKSDNDAMPPSPGVHARAWTHGYLLRQRPGPGFCHLRRTAPRKQRKRPLISVGIDAAAQTRLTVVNKHLYR